jgi:acyl-coenzyme A thioesterase PaaI-like protein
MPSPLHARVQRTLVINRKARLTFPFVFMGLTGRRIGDDDLTLQFEDDRTFRDGKGELSWAVLGMLADGAIGAVARMKAGPRVRPATVHLEMQMTGASTQAPVVAQGHFVTFSEGDRVRQALATATLKSGATLIGHASAAFMLLDLPEGETQPPQAWLPEGFEPEPLDGIVFDANEREALESCARAEAAATEAFPFIEHFWCGIPESAEGKAHLNVQVTPHLGNRAGHAHGGLLLGTAARVANAALPADMRLSNISAWFVSPGLGPRLDVQSSVLQQGRNLSLVRTRILGATGKLVLETMSQHVARCAE